jgi:hypothetical protein
MGTVRQRGETFAGYTELEAKSCPTCGVLYAAPSRLFLEKERHGGDWYCPNGHNIVFCTTMEEKLKRERERAARLAAQRDQAEASARAQRGAATRARNQRDRLRTRAAAGVCPCCNRTFKQLARHMQSQHPYGPIGAHE